ncbi:MAG: DUF2130 domain-containing protein [Phycisphaerales bacterium]
MTDVKIECPHCHKHFKLTETLAAPLVVETRRTVERELQERETALESRRKAFGDEQRAAEKWRKEIEREKAALLKDRERFDERVAEEVAEQRGAIERDAAKKARQKYDEQLAERDAERAAHQEVMKEKDRKLAEAQRAQKDALRKERELDEKLREADLTAEKKAALLVAPQVEKAKKDAEEASRLKLLDKDKTISGLQARLQDAIRATEQGSQQQQGEVQELELERRLREAFPRDTFEAVPKGQFGGDWLHRVLAAHGHRLAVPPARRGAQGRLRCHAGRLRLGAPCADQAMGETPETDRPGDGLHSGHVGRLAGDRREVTSGDRRSRTQGAR